MNCYTICTYFHVIWLFIDTTNEESHSWFDDMITIPSKMRNIVNACIILNDYAKEKPTNEGN